jgi:hypothetical protein
MEGMDLSAMHEIQSQGAMPTGALVAIIGIWLVVMLLMIVSMWKIFAKAGQPGWACIIPIYNLVVLLQIIRKPMWWILMFLIPFVNFIFFILLYVELAKAFGKDAGFAVGLIFLGIIFVPILGFGSAQYVYGEAAS